jgi:hypothetical protein
VKNSVERQEELLVRCSQEVVVVVVVVVAVVAVAVAAEVAIVDTQV